MQFALFCECLQSIEQTSKRLEMTRLVAELLDRLEPAEIKPAIWMMQGSVGPSFERHEFSFAGKMMLRSLDRIFSTPFADAESGIQVKHTTYLEPSLFGEQVMLNEDSTHLEKRAKQVGDLGLLAEQIIRERWGEDKQDSRTVLDVFSALRTLAQASGTGSQEEKIKQMTTILMESAPLSAKFVVRIVLGTLRTGFSNMTILDAVSWVKTGDKSLHKDLELAFQVRGDVATVAEVFLLKGLEAVKKLDVELGVPLTPALCQRLNSADEMIEKMGTVIVEPKYDGTRVLIHLNKSGKDWRVRTFTRNLEETSGMFPELEEHLDEIQAEQVILDCEVVGFDPETESLLPFQLTIKRKRIHDVAEMQQVIPVRAFVFDVLFLNGRSLLQEPLEKRKDILNTILSPSTLWRLAPMIVTDQADELRAYHQAQLGAGLEGVVIKQLQSVYQPGRRGWSWVKFKEAEGQSGKLSDTLECVVMGLYRGKGKRTQFGIGAFLVGVPKKDGHIYTIAKIGTGLSDAQWVEMRERCEQSSSGGTMPEDYVVNDALKPDMWVKPQIVVEIAADELTDSPVHSAGKALRFPRLLRFRDDKSVEQATSVEELPQIKTA